MTLIESEDTSSNVNVYPIGLHDSSLVLKEDNEDFDNKQLEELISNSNSNIAPAAINIENSSDVIIGPVTQFHGPVTIYQNVKDNLRNSQESSMDGRLIKSESTSSDVIVPEKSPKGLRSKHLKWITVSLLLLIAAFIATTAIIVSIKTDSVSSNDSFDHDSDYNNNESRPLLPGSIIPKSRWGGRPALNWTTPLQHPAYLVIISHSVTPTCKDFTECSQRVQFMQSDHVGSGKSPDIGYNFVIGGDGNAYVGRGWDIRNFHRPDSIGICYIGDYVYDYLTPGMISVTKKLIDEGVKSGKLAKDYRIIGHNQTYNTLSPGPHVYEVIKTWPHFDASLYL